MEGKTEVKKGHCERKGGLNDIECYKWANGKGDDLEIRSILLSRSADL
jgi:hypothetical protein